MCRNIKQLRQAETLPPGDQIELAALQYVRKVSGYRKPSLRNTPAFDEAVQEITRSTRVLLERLHASSESALRQAGTG